MASYALSEGASIQSSSLPSRRSQSQLDSYFTGSDVESTSNQDLERLGHEAIQEVSEPVSPESGPPSMSLVTSALTDMLRKSPPSGSPPHHDGRNDDSSEEDTEREDITQGRLIITTNGVQVDATERTPLLGKDPSFVTHHPDWIRGEQDLEDPMMRRKPSWPKLRSLISWPRETGYDIARMVFNPKRWDKEEIWKNTVLAPLHNIPAVILGSELTVLDALSYGMC